MSSNVKAKPQTFSSGGLYGSATTNKYGTTYDPSAFEKKLMEMTTSYIPQYMEQMVNPTYDSPIFQAQTSQRNRLAQQSFENNLMNPLASRGLTRGSSINQMSNQFANKLADLEVDAMANEDTRNANMVNDLFGYYQIPYDMMMGMSKFSSNQYQQAVQNALKQNQLNNEAMNNWASSIGNVSQLALKAAQGGMATGTPGVDPNGLNWGSLLGSGLGYMVGGPAGAQVGGMAGSQIGGWIK